LIYRAYFFHRYSPLFPHNMVIAHSQWSPIRLRSCCF
jgi:hypothetical protein